MVRRELSAGARCSALIQDSHGWCFYATRDGLRVCLELIPVSVEDGRSSWMLQTFFEPGVRVWQHLRRGQTSAEAQLSAAAIKVLAASPYRFSTASAPTPN